MTPVYVLTTVRDDGEACVTKFEGYFAERAADAAFRECSGPGNRFHMVYARLVVRYHIDSEIKPEHDVRSLWPKLEAS